MQFLFIYHNLIKVGEIKNLSGWGPLICVFNKSSRWFLLKYETHCSRSKILKLSVMDSFMAGLQAFCNSLKFYENL